MPTKDGALAPTDSHVPQKYDPEQGLKTIAVAEAAEKALTRQLRNNPNDPFVRQELRDVIKRKISEQADYAVWRPVYHGGDRKSETRFQNRNLDLLPSFDPGDVAIHRWRKKFCEKIDKHQWKRDESKMDLVVEDSWHRSTRICEAHSDGTVRGTEGTGEFERYTPANYIEAVRLVLGEIDIDPASSHQAQQTVNAKYFLTEEDDGLKHEWPGRVFLNPPYHRELAPKFINKLVEEYRFGTTTAAILLINNVTDTAMFDVAGRVAASICFPRHRIPFTQPNGAEVSPTQGQVFMYLGLDPERFEDVFCVFGMCWRPSREYERPE